MFFEQLVGLFTLSLIRLLALAACGASDSDKAAEHYVQGTVYTAAGQWQNVIKEINESIRIEPDLSDAYYNRAIAYGDLGVLGRLSRITPQLSG